MELPPLDKVGEQIQNFIGRADQLEERVYQKTRINPLLAQIALSLSSVTLMTAGINAADRAPIVVEYPVASELACAVDCTPVPAAAAEVQAAPPDTATTTVEVPTPSVYVRPKVEGINPTVQANMNAMQLSVEGYTEFFSKIDRSQLEYAQTKNVFNENIVGTLATTTLQRLGLTPVISEDFLWHYLGYEPTTLPDGQINIPAVVDFISGRSEVCCAMNWVIDNDKVLQLAPADAKLWSNPPYLMRAVEVRAPNQESITPKQYELLTYLTIADLVNQNMLDPANPVIRAVGHGEIRTDWNANHPTNSFDVKTDFATPAAQYLRILVQEFVSNHPEIVNLTQPL